MKFLRRFSAIFVIVLSLIGILFSLFSLYQVWRLREPVQRGITAVLDLSDGLLSTAEDGVTVVDSALESAITSLGKLEETTQTIAQSIEDTGKMANTFAGLFKNDLKDTLLNTRLSVIAAKSSAKVIDTLLYGLSNLPFLGIKYEPPLPLNESLEDIAGSMDGLPGSLDEISDNLDSSQSNIATLRDQVDSMTGSLQEIQTSLKEARAVIADSQAKIDELQGWSARLRNNLPYLLWGGVIFLTLMLLSLAMAQLGSMAQAYDVLRGKTFHS
jgi:methyl-accepting chemotaxis protein